MQSPQGSFSPASQSRTEGDEQSPDNGVDNDLNRKEKDQREEGLNGDRKEGIEEDGDGSSDSDGDGDGDSGSDDDSNGDSSSDDDDSDDSDDSDDGSGDSSDCDDESSGSEDGASSKGKEKAGSDPTTPIKTPGASLAEEEGPAMTMPPDPRDDLSNGIPSSPHEEVSDDMMSKILKAQLDLTTRFDAEVQARTNERKELWGMLDVLNHNIKCLLEADDIENEDMAYVKGSLKYLVDCLGPVKKARMDKKGMR